MKKDHWKAEEISEDFCFTCKDGGLLRVCDFRTCLKAYHPSCVGKEDTLLDDDDRWTCGLHSCNCGKSSSFQCFCCPTSYCHSCITSAGFVQVKKNKEKNKGFCINCLRLAKMVEEDKDVGSDGEAVDFSNTETYAFLFKDYWAIVKDREGLTLVDVQAADALLKRGENFQNDSDSDKPIDERSMLEPDDLNDDCDDEKPLFKGLRGKRGRRKNQINKPKKERAFIGWASEELHIFLAAIGKNTKESLSQLDVTEIVKDYVQSKNLFEPNKKRKNHVVPDEKLRMLFRKKKLKFHKIFDLVKNHLAEEQSDQSDEFSLSSEEDVGTILTKKRWTTSSDHKTPMSETNHCRKRVLEPSKSCFAAVVADNIKHAYLKRSLVLELLKHNETFEDKVVGCFVRIKTDPKDFYFLSQNAYQLGQVTGIKKTDHTYNIGETSTDIVLRISNFSKDIKIPAISDDDFEEEECQNLQQLVKKGLFRQPTIAEFERKIRSVHEDIVNHWISRELVKLQKQIDRANEKGWRKELNEYIDRRELLRTPDERMRLVKEIPEVVPDPGDTDVNLDRSVNIQGLNKDTHDQAGKSVTSVEGLAEKPKESEVKSRSMESEGHEVNDETSTKISGAATEVEIIDLDDEEDEDDDGLVDEGNHTVHPDANAESSEATWHYRDPSGEEQGPFAFIETQMGAPKVSPIIFDDGAVGLRIVAAMSAGSMGPARPVKPRSDPIPILGRAGTAVTPKAKEDAADDDGGDGDVELSESYTCVTSRVGGETVRKLVYLVDDANDDGSGICGKFEMNSGVFFESPPGAAGPSIPGDFLSCCYLCRKKLHGLDIFMYRGDKAFCSAECRCQQIVNDERKENCRSEAGKARGSPLPPCLSPLPFDAGVAAA